jgi:uncharacterized protein (DUF1778 family)
MRTANSHNTLTANSLVVTKDKDARLELRTSVDIKEQLRLAATLAGVDMSSFILMVATQKAQELIYAEHQRVLSEAQWNKLNDAIMSPRQPGEQLKGLMQGKPRYVRR